MPDGNDSIARRHDTGTRGPSAACSHQAACLLAGDTRRRRVGGGRPPRDLSRPDGNIAIRLYGQVPQAGGTHRGDAPGRISGQGGGG